MKTIVLTGGGTAGHINPNIALIPHLQSKGYEVHYLGQKDGMEQKLVSSIPGVTYHCVRSGKLRRYFSLKNFTDPFKVIAGYFDASKAIKAIRPALVFSKGGFVSVPVCAAGKRRHVPVILHESDYTPGLANKLAVSFASKVLVTFEDTLPHIKGNKAVCTGTPIRQELYGGDRGRALTFLGFEGSKPILLCMGGSQGAAALNDALRENLPQLLPRFDIVHLCGKGKLSPAHEGLAGYRQYEYLGAELPDVFAAASLAISRAGANSIFEFLALAIPMLLIPLPLSASRGDQLLNADYFKRKGWADVLFQEDVTKESLLDAINALFSKREKMAALMRAAPAGDGTENVLREIYAAAEEK